MAHGKKDQNKPARRPAWRSLRVLIPLVLLLWFFAPTQILKYQLNKNGFKLKHGRVTFLGTRISSAGLVIDLGQGNLATLEEMNWGLTNAEGKIGNLFLSNEFGSIVAKDLNMTKNGPLTIQSNKVHWDGQDPAAFLKNLNKSQPSPTEQSQDLVLDFKIHDLPFDQAAIHFKLFSAGSTKLIRLNQGTNKLALVFFQDTLQSRLLWQGHRLNAQGTLQGIGWQLKPIQGPLTYAQGMLWQSSPKSQTYHLAGDFKGKASGKMAAHLNGNGWQSRAIFDQKNSELKFGGASLFAQGNWSNRTPDSWWLQAKDWTPGRLTIPVTGSLWAHGEKSEFHLGLKSLALNGQPILDHLATNGNWPKLPEMLEVTLPGQKPQAIDLAGDQVDLSIPLEPGRVMKASYQPNPEGGGEISLYLPGGRVQADLASSLLPMGPFSALRLRAQVDNSGEVLEAWSSGALEGHWQSATGRWQGQMRNLDLRKNPGSTRVVLSGGLMGKSWQGQVQNLKAKIYSSPNASLDLEINKGHLSQKKITLEKVSVTLPPDMVPGQIIIKNLTLEPRDKLLKFRMADFDGQFSVDKLPPITIQAKQIKGTLADQQLRFKSPSLATQLGDWNRRGSADIHWNLRHKKGKAKLDLAWLPESQTGDPDVPWPAMHVSLKGGLKKINAKIQSSSMPAREGDQLSQVLDLLPMQLAEGALKNTTLDLEWDQDSGVTGTLDADLEDVQVHFTRADWRNLRQIHAHMSARFSDNDLTFTLEKGTFEGDVPFTVSLQGDPRKRLPVTGTLGPVPIQDFIDGVFDYLPGTLAYGSWSGNLMVNLKGDLSANSNHRFLDFSNQLDAVSFTNEDGEAELKNIQGVLPMRFHLDPPATPLPGDASIDEQNLESSWQELGAFAAGGQLSIDRLTYTGLTLGPMVLRVQATEKGYTTLGLPATEFLQGKLAGRLRLRLGVDNQSFSGLLVGRQLSLNDLCNTYEPIKGYVRGKLNLGLNFRDQKFDLPNLVGILRIWTQASKTEPMDVARQFLVGVGGPQFEAVFKGNRLRYDVGRLEVAIKEGQVSFHDLQLKHQADGLANLLRQDITYEVNIPKGDKNRVSLARLLELMKKYS